MIAPDWPKIRGCREGMGRFSSGFPDQLRAWLACDVRVLLPVSAGDETPGHAGTRRWNGR
jgi:hypothetical protein